MSDCCVVRNNIQLVMIRSFRHKGLRQFFEKGTLSGIQAHHANRLRM